MTDNYANLFLRAKKVKNPSRSFQTLAASCLSLALAASCLSVAPFHLAMEALRLEAPVREGQERGQDG